jgi:hypothetical protein
MIRFSDLAPDDVEGPLAESWVLFETPGGHLLHSSACKEIGDLDFGTQTVPESEIPPFGNPHKAWSPHDDLSE